MALLDDPVPRVSEVSEDDCGGVRVDDCVRLNCAVVTISVEVGRIVVTFGVVRLAAS